MSDKPAIRIAATLESVFKRILSERMHDMPMVNPNLSVHAIGFQPWRTHYIGVLSTPWFMNLMLLPGAEDDWNEMTELSKQNHTFPSGIYEFITGSEPEIGKYQMCSLFSPMFEFADDDTAVETAWYVIDGLMQPENQDEHHVQANEIERIWYGDRDEKEALTVSTDDVPTSEPETQPETLQQRLDRPISRRRLLRGLFDENPAD